MATSLCLIFHTYACNELRKRIELAASLNYYCTVYAHDNAYSR
jgi:hypothetical protein